MHTPTFKLSEQVSRWHSAGCCARNHRPEGPERRASDMPAFTHATHNYEALRGLTLSDRPEWNLNGSPSWSVTSDRTPFGDFERSRSLFPPSPRKAKRHGILQPNPAGLPTHSHPCRPRLFKYGLSKGAKSGYGVWAASGKEENWWQRKGEGGEGGRCRSEPPAISRIISHPPNISISYDQLKGCTFYAKLLRLAMSHKRGSRALHPPFSILEAQAQVSIRVK
ncbi:hypothetical protein BX600DRAFT_434088 [Xylariales sp. PMI_506]|nr:hypothetical protein BX600DRAFT_434088 [Xylariales sp. PMI_506]